MLVLWCFEAAACEIVGRCNYRGSFSELALVYNTSD